MHLQCRCSPFVPFVRSSVHRSRIGFGCCSFAFGFALNVLKCAECAEEIGKKLVTVYST